MGKATTILDPNVTVNHYTDPSQLAESHFIEMDKAILAGAKASIVSGTFFTSVLASRKSTPARMSLHAAYQDPKPSQWLSQNAGVPAVKIAFTVGGTEGAKDLFGLFDDTITRLLAAGTRP